MLEKTYTLELPDGVKVQVDREWLSNLHEQLSEEFKVGVTLNNNTLIGPNTRNPPITSPNTPWYGHGGVYSSSEGNNE